MASSFTDLLRFVRNHRAGRAEALVAGQALNYADYQHEVGFIAAMDLVETEIIKGSDTAEGVEMGETNDAGRNAGPSRSPYERPKERNLGRA